MYTVVPGRWILLWTSRPPSPTRRQRVAEYPEPRPEWAERAEERGATASFPAWVHQQPAPFSAPLPLPRPVQPDPWAAKHMAAAGPDTPVYGSPEWSALDDNSPVKAAACVRAAQAWLEAKDPAVIAEQLQAEIAAARAEAQRVQLLGVVETVHATANRVAQQVEPFSPPREVRQTPDWPPVAQPGRPVPAAAAVEAPAVPLRALPSVPTAYVTAETRAGQAAARAADPIRRAGQGAAPRSPAPQPARSYWEQQQRATARTAHAAGRGR